MTVAEIAEVLNQWFPPALAESWDNVGVLLGDASVSVDRVMTCLTVTSETANEAIRDGAGLIVSHHPILFRPIQRLVADGPLAPIYRLARAGVAVFSPHTAFDSAREGINRQIADLLRMQAIAPIRVVDFSPSSEVLPPPPAVHVTTEGTGRWGELSPPVPLAELAGHLKGLLAANHVDYVGDAKRECATVAIGCGAAGELLDDAVRLGCDVFVTGEVRFHDALRAQAIGIGMILAGHYATERFAVEWLAERIGQHWPQLTVWASREEYDPFTPAC